MKKILEALMGKLLSFQPAVARIARIVVGFLIAKLAVVPAVDKIPGLSAYLGSPDLQNYLAVGIGALLNAIMKHLRDKNDSLHKLPV